VTGRFEQRTRSKEFQAFLRQIDRDTPKDKQLHIVLDNAVAHKTREVQDWLAQRPRIHFYSTLISASWLNGVENWFAQFERRALYRRAFSSVAEVKAELKRYIKVHNRDLPKPFRRTKTAERTHASVERAREALPT
jgi:transposase